MPGTSFCAHLSAPENLPVYRDKKEPPKKKDIEMQKPTVVNVCSIFLEVTIIFYYILIGHDKY